MDPLPSGSRHLVLASASPRRRGYLNQLGYDFEAATPQTEEKRRAGETPEAYVRRNALEKSADVAGRVSPRAVVVAADTVVALRGRIMEKPAGAEGAREMLTGAERARAPGDYGSVRARAWSGRRGEGAVVRGDDGRGVQGAAGRGDRGVPRSGEPMDKAGAYAIQGRAAYMIRRIAGSYTNVVGLPLTELEETLSAEFGVKPTFHGPAGA
jgi:septum formation protein